MMSARLLHPVGGFGPKHLRRSQGKPLQMERGARKKGTPSQQKRGSQIWIVGSARRLQLEPIIGVILIQLNQSEVGGGRAVGVKGDEELEGGGWSWSDTQDHQERGRVQSSPPVAPRPPLISARSLKVHLQTTKRIQGWSNWE